jgi:c-di-GMP-binding flagellar brake protein YcgR
MRENRPTIQGDTEVCNFESIGLQVGDRVQLELLADSLQTRHLTSLIGYVKGQSVLVRTPMVMNLPIQVSENEPLLIRAFSGRSAFAFESSVIRVGRSPYPYLHLAYPQQVRTVTVRGAMRVRSELAATSINLKRDPAGTPQPGIIADLSVTGAQLDSQQELGSIGDRLQLFFNFTLAPAGYEVKLSPEVTVQSCRKVNDGRTGKNFYRHGLHFENMHTTESLLVQSFIQQVMLEDRSRLV